MTESGDWEELKVDNDYEIFSEFPYAIRRKGSDKLISEHSGKDGYLIIALNGRCFKKHRAIAIQWIPNPDNLPQVDHKNKIKSDYHLDNLRWVTKSENAKNRLGNKGVKYEYVDDLPNESIEVTHYGTHEFENLWFHGDEFYLWNGLQFRKLHRILNKVGTWMVRTLDVNGERTFIYYTKFKREYDLI